MENLETTALYALGIPIIAIAFLFEWWVGRRRGKKVFSHAETLSNLSAGLGTLVIGMITGPLVYFLYKYVYENVSFFRVDHGILKWIVAFLVTDFCYYVWHRAGHTFGLLWAVHGVHHQHEYLNGTVGLRLEWLADFGTLLFFAPMPLLGIDPTTGFITIAILSLYTLTTHSAVLIRPSFGILVTPATHGSHHSRDSRFDGKNFGAMFVFWDKLFGTHYSPDFDREFYLNDIPTVSRCHDGVKAQWVLVLELMDRIKKANSWKEVFYLLFGPPIVDDASIYPVPRPESEISSALRIYTTIDFLIILFVACWTLWFRDSILWVGQLAGGVFVIWGLKSIGRLMDKGSILGFQDYLRPAFAIFVSVSGYLFLGLDLLPLLIGGILTLFGVSIFSFSNVKSLSDNSKVC